MLVDSLYFLFVSVVSKNGKINIRNRFYKINENKKLIRCFVLHKKY